MTCFIRHAKAGRWRANLLTEGNYHLNTENDTFQEENWIVFLSTLVSEMKDKKQIEFDYLTKTGLLLQYPEMEEGFQKRTFTISDVGVTTRVMNSWEKSGLFRSNKARLRRKFNLEEIIWLKIIKQLKKFDVKLPIIKALNEELMGSVDLNAMAQSEGIKEEVIKVLGVGTKSKNNNELEKMLDNILGMDIVKAAFSQINISTLGLLIRDAVILKNHISILVNDKGEAVPFKELYSDVYYKNPDFLDFIRTTYVSVSLTQIIKQFIKDHTTEAHVTFAIITAKEYELLELLGKKKVKSAKVIFDEEGQMKYLHLTQSKNHITQSEVLDVILTHPYSDIEIRTQNGKITHFENTRKIKL